MGEAWADYLVSAVSYGEGRRIRSARQHADTGGELGKGEIVDRDTIVHNLADGKTYATVFAGKQKWVMGDAIRLVGGRDGDPSVRTDRNAAAQDSLRMLPELE